MINDKDVYHLSDNPVSEGEFPSRKRLNTQHSSRKEQQVTGIKLPSGNYLKRSANYICRWLQYFVTEKLNSFPKGVSDAFG
jgi:hypothetical protein